MKKTGQKTPRHTEPLRVGKIIAGNLTECLFFLMCNPNNSVKEQILVGLVFFAQSL